MNTAFAKKLKQKQLVTILAVVLVVAVLAVLGCLWTWHRNSASSYSDCVKQGNAVIYSYPSVCVDKNGQHFTNPAEQSPIVPQEVKPQ